MKSLLIVSLGILISSAATANVLQAAQNRICAERNVAFERAMFKASLQDGTSTLTQKAGTTIAQEMRNFDLLRKHNMEQAMIMCQWVRQNAPVKNQCVVDLLQATEGMKFFIMQLDRNQTAPSEQPLLTDYISDLCNQGLSFGKKVCIVRQFREISNTTGGQWPSANQVATAVTQYCEQ